MLNKCEENIHTLIRKEKSDYFRNDYSRIVLFECKNCKQEFLFNGKEFYKKNNLKRNCKEIF